MGKNFYLKLSFFILLFIGTYFFVVHQLSQGYVDVYYPKFTQRAESLIIGLSRGHDGISPDVIADELDSFPMARPLINFAFDKYQSPYGEIYLEGIAKKIGENTEDGLFILTLSPGGFTIPGKMDDDAILKMDKKMIMGKLSDFHSNPNYNYIVKCYAQSLYAVYNRNNLFENQVTHPNGWNEIKVYTEESEISEADMKHWKSLTLRGYEQIMKKEKISAYRIRHFVKTLTFLKERGTVLMVRLPSDPDIIALENAYWSNFSEQMDSISIAHKVPFFDYTKQPHAYKTYDGSHLVSRSAVEFSKRLGGDIRAYLKEQNN
ncbi:hypothetical protein [Spongiimicrobium sp. 2-473A-2-J]|uniref:hypothetical protein n=1 Tax=Eudoraea algarum TaxID=3417568 RepID=UPI003D35E9E8